MKDSVYLVNVDEYASIETDWITLSVNGGIVTYFDRFLDDHIPKEIKRFVGNKNIITNIFRILAYDSKM